MTDPETTADSAVQKKKSGKRTARACDECRLRKSKCDGLQPCEACQSTDRYCTYNLSASRGTGSGTRIRILEDRLRRARAYLNEAQKRTPSLAHVNFDALLGPLDEYSRSEVKTRNDSITQESDDEAELIESMMDAYGRMNLDANGRMERDFYGAASGLAWIQTTRNYFDHAGRQGSDNADLSNSAAYQLFDAPLPLRHALDPHFSTPRLLPPRGTARKLLHVVFTQVYPMFHFLDEGDFEEATDRIYAEFPHDPNSSEQSFLPLFYLVMALGYLFSREEHITYGCRASVAEAMRYFVAARGMLDIAHLRSITALQTVVALILYLVSTARMVSAHAFLGAACAAAMRQGLHFRSSHETLLPNREIKVRRKLFWTIMNLDMYITSILGLPPLTDVSAVDPAIDLTIASALQEAVTDPDLSISDGIALGASARHIELMRIISKAQRTLFPKPTDPPNSRSQHGTIFVNVQKLQEVERQFREWVSLLTNILSSSDNSVETKSVKYEVLICYYFSQIVLYRAFLHYLAKKNDDSSVGQRQLAYASTCVNMAKKAIELSAHHQRRGLLCPASWPSVYTVFLSTVCLVFAYATRDEGTDAAETKQDIESGIQLLACTACTTDTGSVRCLEILRRLIERVSYAVDVDLDGICKKTRPCCSTEQTQKASATLNASKSEPGASQLSSPESANKDLTPEIVPTTGSGVRRWSLSPDVTMTQPSFSEIVHGRDVPESQIDQMNLEQTIEIPYGGSFGWQDYSFSTADTTTMHSPSNHQSLPSRTRQEIEATKLTPEEIAAFMQSNPVDFPFSSRPR